MAGVGVGVAEQRKAGPCSGFSGFSVFSLRLTGASPTHTGEGSPAHPHTHTHDHTHNGLLVRIVGWGVPTHSLPPNCTLHHLYRQNATRSSWSGCDTHRPRSQYQPAHLSVHSTWGLSGHADPPAVFTNQHTVTIGVFSSFNNLALLYIISFFYQVGWHSQSAAAGATACNMQRRYQNEIWTKRTTMAMTTHIPDFSTENPGFLRIDAGDCQLAH